MRRTAVRSELAVKNQNANNVINKYLRIFVWFCLQGSVKLKSLAVETGAASRNRRSAMATMTVVMAQMSLNVQNVSAFIY